MTKTQSTIIKFSIKGSRPDGLGNPLPKLHTTRNQFWTEKAQKYVAYKSFVLACILDQTKSHPARAMIVRNIGLYGKPLTTSSEFRARMDLEILWRDNTHGDAENVFGAIADSLFKQDKYLDGSFTGKLSENKQAIVNVMISLNCPQ